MSDNDVPEVYRQASIKTMVDLRTMATMAQMRDLSRLSLPEITELTEEIARVVPAGNVPGMILSGLARLGGRDVQVGESRKYVGLLFRGVQQTLDKAVYGAFFAGPAAVLHGYQQILKLAGKDLDSAFPEGTWQFYLEFALREDSARHANETTGFQNQLLQHGIRLRPEDALAAWILTTAYFLHKMPEILANEWYERVTLNILAELGEQLEKDDFRNLFAEWDRKRPYRRSADSGNEDYPTFRRHLFDAFLERYLSRLPEEARKTYERKLLILQRTSLAPYQKQMTWLAYLEPDGTSESRTHYRFDDALVGVIWKDRYYLLPVPDLLDPERARALAAAILASVQPSQPSATLDDALVCARRAEHPTLRKQLDKETLQELDYLRRASVLINWDERNEDQAMAFIRRGKRGLGDHALTIFRTPGSMVFDQSHIFFDGTWGAAIAEIMTNEALSWAGYVAQIPPASPDPQTPYSPGLQAYPAFTQQAIKVFINSETGAETTAVKLNAMLGLRKLLKQRSDLASVTVNDLLILYRGLHASIYQPSAHLQAALKPLATDPRPAAQQAYKMIQQEFARLSGKNPAILIPIDASRHDPRERLFPTTFRNPLTDFYAQHQRTLNALHEYKEAESKARGGKFKTFNHEQAQYLRLIGGFGELLSRYRQIAMSGQSLSTASIRFLANMPPAMQKLLDAIPGKFDVLNEIIKGEEVFSNMGRVAKGSSLRRFITAKDDNEQKTLAWGVMTDDKDVMHLSLRDFRPHVEILFRLGMTSLAQMMAQDYLDTFADGLNRYISELREITVASRETIMQQKDR